MDYKAPLLPSNTTVTFNDNECYRHRRLSKWAITLSVIALTCTFLSGYSHYRSINNESCTITTSSTFVGQEDQSVGALLESTLSSNGYWCPQPSDSWETVASEFTVPASVYQGLDIQQKVSKHVNFQTGYANVVVDDTIQETTVHIDLSFYNPDDQEFVEIRTEERKSEGLLFLVIDLKHPHPVDNYRICLKADVTVTLSSSSVLNTLTLSLPNDVITVHGDDNPVFSSLVLRTANGRITTTEFVTSNSIVLSTANGGIQTSGLRGTNIELSTANGYIDANIDSLSGNLIASSANANIDINIATISGTSSEVKVTTVNANIDVSLPDAFETSFDLSTVVGHNKIQSNDHPEKIHYKGSHNGRHVQGYYGDNKQQTENAVKVSSVSGRSSVVFV
ncbi:hypothetical protein INT45_008522 [Circinella minor]|uniref:DUF4097 domain-containing protein n=1 Tax=Circinella minor TaxID=1195481 RepID=A0A8H7SFS0_9FUNG|nr:hypothetical protein INT45_008522 [Circinella minor]